MSNIKQPQIPTGDRIQARTQRVDTDNEHPVFSLTYLSEKKFSIKECDKTDQAALVKKLVTLSRMTWKQIKTAHRHGTGFEKIDRSQINGKVPEFISGDVELFLAFRFSGKKPMVGHRSESVFYILWLDPKMTLYDHG